MTSGMLIGQLAQIPRGEGRAFEIAGRRIAVFHTQSGEVLASQAECPHRNGPLADGLTGGTTVICPLHERAYDLRTGQGLGGECTRLQTYPISVSEDGRMWLTSARSPEETD